MSERPGLDGHDVSPLVELDLNGATDDNPRAKPGLAANAVFMDAFYTDVRADLAAWRESRGLPADPMAAFASSGYLKRIAAERVGGTQSGWGA